MEHRLFFDALTLAMGLTPGFIVGFTARMEFGMPVPLALLMGLGGAVLARRMLLSPVV